MKLFAGLEAIVKTDEPLAPHTWFGIGGPAQYFIEPTHAARSCRTSSAAAARTSLPVRVLGGGANLLVDDAGVRGAVIHLAGEEFTPGRLQPTAACSAGAGADMGKLVLRCVREGWAAWSA